MKAILALTSIALFLAGVAAKDSLEDKTKDERAKRGAYTQEKTGTVKVTYSTPLARSAFANQLVAARRGSRQVDYRANRYQSGGYDDRYYEEAPPYSNPKYNLDEAYKARAKPYGGYKASGYGGASAGYGGGYGAQGGYSSSNYSPPPSYSPSSSYPAAPSYASTPSYSSPPSYETPSYSQQSYPTPAGSSYSPSYDGGSYAGQSYFQPSYEAPGYSAPPNYSPPSYPQQQSYYSQPAYEPQNYSPPGYSPAAASYDPAPSYPQQGYGGGSQPAAAYSPQPISYGPPPQQGYSSSSPAYSPAQAQPYAPPSNYGQVVLPPMPAYGSDYSGYSSRKSYRTTCGADYINCVVDSHISCRPNNEIHVVLEFESPFNGVIYVWNKLSECVLYKGGSYGPGHKVVRFSITDSTCPSYQGFRSPSGSDFEDPSAFRGRQMRVGIIFDPEQIHTREDVNFVVRCESEDAHRRNTFNEYYVKDRNPVILTKTERISKIRAVIRKGTDIKAPIVNTAVLLGSKLLLQISLIKKANPKTQILATHCIAVEGPPLAEEFQDNQDVEAQPRVVNLISNGCSVRPKIIDNFVQISEKVGNKMVVSIVALFQAIRFPNSDTIAIRCKVHICTSRCEPPPRCRRTFVSDRVGQQIFRAASDRRRRLDERELAHIPLQVLLAQQKPDPMMASSEVDLDYDASDDDTDGNKKYINPQPQPMGYKSSEETDTRKKRDLRGPEIEVHYVDAVMRVKHVQGEPIYEMRNKRSAAPPALNFTEATAWAECDEKSATLSFTKSTSEDNSTASPALTGSISLKPWMAADDDKCTVKTEIKADQETATIKLDKRSICDNKKAFIYHAVATDGKETKEAILDCQEEVLITAPPETQENAAVSAPETE